MKIKVDETGTFGREVNPNLKPTYNEKYPDVLNNPEWHKFEAGVKSYPLTSPQVPLSVVDGELEWQYMHPFRKDWNNCNHQDYSRTHSTRQVFSVPKTIDGFAHNSEISYECADCGWDIGLIKTSRCPKCNGLRIVTSEP